MANKAAAKGTAVAKSAPGKAVSTNDKKASGGALAIMEEMEGDASAGLENTDKDSFVTPFLMVIQKGSPQVDRSQPQYIKGAEVGDLMLSTTGEVWKEDGVNIVICGFERKFLKWLPRDEGGGFRGQLTVAQFNAAVNAGTITDTDGALVTEDGEVVKDTRLHYILVLREDGSYTPAVLSMASTQVKKSKVLMTQISTYKQEGKNGKFTPPSFAHVFLAQSVPEQNDKGSWSGWKLTRQDFVNNAELYKAAKEFHDLTANTEIKLDTGATEDTSGRV